MPQQYIYAAAAAACMYPYIRPTVPEAGSSVSSVSSVSQFSPVSSVSLLPPQHIYLVAAAAAYMQGCRELYHIGENR